MVWGHGQCPVRDLYWVSVAHAPVRVVRLRQVVGFHTEDGVHSLLGGAFLGTHAPSPGHVAGWSVCGSNIRWL
jgi:hypothetical protein